MFSVRPNGKIIKGRAVVSSFRAQRFAFFDGRERIARIRAGQETTETSGVSPPAGPGEGGRPRGREQNEKGKISCICRPRSVWKHDDSGRGLEVFLFQKAWSFIPPGIVASSPRGRDICLCRTGEERTPFVAPICLWVACGFCFFLLFFHFPNTKFPL